MKFRVHVYLPAVKSAAPLQFEELGTNLLLFSHHIHDISNSAYFGRVRMRTSDRPLECSQVAEGDRSIRSVHPMQAVATS